MEGVQPMVTYGQLLEIQMINKWGNLHSYFLNIKTVDDLRFVWYNEIIPLLMEYFYNDWESLKEILKDFVDGKKPHIQINHDLIDDDLKLYEIKEYEGEEFIRALNSVIA